jgi:endonuclease YncB( thermonuclease family)
MTPRTRMLSVLLFALALALGWAAVAAQDVPAPTPPADGELAWVVAVVDGDTIRVDRGSGISERLRYIGIDTPETVHPAVPVEPWGPEAAAANAELVAGEQVLLERDVSEFDRFDRLLRYVWVDTPDGWRMVNAELVALGLAEVRAYPPDTRHHQYLHGLEEAARQSGVGLHGSRPRASAEPEPSAEAAGLLERLLDLLLGER